MTTSLSIICGMDENRLIGINNTLPWHLPADMAHFKQTTMHKPILMGRKTYESIGRPLPGRRNIIITRDTNYSAEGCDTVHSIQQAIDLVNDHDEVMLIGGSSLYEQTIPMAKTLYITEIHHQFSGDSWFPVINSDYWLEASREEHDIDESNKYAYSFVKYTHK